MAQIVEHEDAGVRLPGFGLDPGAVVDGVDVAAPGHDHQQRAGHRRRDGHPATAVRVRTVAVTAASARQAPAVASRITVVGSNDTSTKPVRNTPASDPSVPAADSLPITAPEPSTLERHARVTAGVTIASAVTDTSVDTATSTTAAYGPGPNAGPRSRISGRTTSTPSPPTASAPAATRRGGSTSDQRPPSDAPAAIPASATPITAVVDSMVRPT